MYHLYVLLSQLRKRTYIGISADVEKRLYEHNAGCVRSTKACRPFRVIYQETFESKTDARKRELRLKRHSATKEALLCKLGLKK